MNVLLRQSFIYFLHLVETAMKQLFAINVPYTPIIIIKSDVQYTIKFCLKKYNGILNTYHHEHEMKSL